MEPLLDGGTKIYLNGPGHMTKMACMPIYMYGKNLKNLLFWNQKADDLESWYVASVLEYYQVCSNDNPGSTLTYLRQG